MAEFKHESKQVPPRREDTEHSLGEAAAAGAAGTENGEKLKAELDDLLNEIDGVLETNAERFVKDFIQKGGE